MKRVDGKIRQHGGWIVTACALLAAHAFGEEVARVVFCEGWSTVFGGKPVSYHVNVDAPVSTRGRVQWHLSMNRRTLRRGEVDVSPTPAQPAHVELSLDIPEIRDGVVMRAELAAAFVPLGSSDSAASAEKTLWVFGEDPFAHRKQWLGNLNISLFDPEEKTAAVLKEAGVPFKGVGVADSLAEARGIVIVGEGVSFRDYRALPALLTQAAASGAAVLCLAPAGGECGSFAEGGETTVPDAMSFRRSDVIRELDKRLDADSWPPDGVVVAGGLKLVGQRGPVVGEVVDGSGGWPWVRLDYGGGGTFVVTGFPIVEKWQESPSPRYLFARLLEVLADESHKQEGAKK